MKSFYLVVLLLFSFGLQAEEVDVSKPLIITTISGKTSLPPLSAKMTDDSLEIAARGTITVIRELRKEIASYIDERDALIDEIAFYRVKEAADAEALNKIIDKHRGDRAVLQASILSLVSELASITSIPASQKGQERLNLLKDKLSISEQRKHELDVEKTEIIRMRNEFETSSQRTLEILKEKIARWENGNLVKLNLAYGEELKLVIYSIELNKIVNNRYPPERKKGSPRGKVAV